MFTEVAKKLSLEATGSQITFSEVKVLLKDQVNQEIPS